MKKRALNNPIVRKIGTWLLMLVISAVIRRLTGQTKSSKTSRKFVKNRAR